MSQYTRQRFGAAYRRTKEQYPKWKCSAILLSIWKSTKAEWTYDELRFMTGYSVFTIAQAVGFLKKSGHTVNKGWDVDSRSHTYHIK